LTVLWPGYAPWTDTVTACRAEFVRTARSFWLVPEAIPSIARDDVSLLYCFCRQLDDAIDSTDDVAKARQTLERWRAELHGDAPARPLIAAFRAGAPRSGLPLHCADHLLDGMECDLGPVRIAEDAELIRYAYRVSSAVGLMLAPLLGVSGSEALRRVVDLGIALQISNVLLGVAEDARIDRVYLPANRLGQEDLSADDVLAAANDESPSARLLPVLRGLADLADIYYRSAEQGAIYVPLRYRHGVVLLGRFYSALGRRAASGLSAPKVPAGLPLRLKLRQLAELGPIALQPHVLGLVPPRAHDPSLHAALERSWPGVHA
jgi:phytoene synthase